MACGNWTSALRHLVAHGTLDGRSVVEGSVTIHDMSRSNEVAMVCVDGEPLLVLKRRGVAVDAVDPLGAEVGCLRWLASEASTAGVAPDIITTFDDVVVMTAVPDAATLSEALQRTDAPNQSHLLGGLGALLARVHTAEPDRTLLLQRWPWVLDVAHRKIPEMFMGDPGIELLVDRVNTSAALVAALDRMRAGWTTDAVIHGDIKFDNVVVTAGSSEPRKPELVLVDWELAGLGPPAWDLAGVAVGQIVPRLLQDELAGDRIDVAEVGRHLEPVLDIYCAMGAPAVDDLSFRTAIITRLVQVSFQLCAMRHLDQVHDDSSSRIFGAVASMACSMDVHDGLVAVS